MIFVSCDVVMMCMCLTVNVYVWICDHIVIHAYVVKSQTECLMTLQYHMTKVMKITLNQANSASCVFGWLPESTISVSAVVMFDRLQ